MSDIRHDPLNDIWVAMADNRRERPMEFVPVEQIRKQIICPFCKGNESETPTPVAVYGSDGERKTEPGAEFCDDWSSRVVLNKYPSFSASTSGNPNDYGSRYLKRMTLPGAQELIIPSSRHVTSISDLTDDELEVCFLAQRDRIEGLSQIDHVKHVMLFLNCRSAAGASLGHLHWQVIGSPLVSPSLQRRCERNEESRKQNGKSLIQMQLARELEEDERVLTKTDNFAIVCPFASQFPFQVKIFPFDPEVEFHRLDSDRRNELAWLCRDVVERLEKLLDSPAYNILLQIPPFEESSADQWYLDIFPRITTAAGYELGTNVWVNPVVPEKAVRALRAAKNV